MELDKSVLSLNEWESALKDHLLNVGRTHTQFTKNCPIEHASLDCLSFLCLGSAHQSSNMVFGVLLSRLATHATQFRFKRPGDLWLRSNRTAWTLSQRHVELSGVGRLGVRLLKLYKLDYRMNRLTSIHNLGIASHLVAWLDNIPLSRHRYPLISPLIKIQDKDGFIYPLPGGAACSELNTTNIFIWALRGDNSRIECEQIRQAIFRTATGILSARSSLLVDENFGGSANLRTRHPTFMSLPSLTMSMRWRLTQRLVPKSPYWWTLIRLLTVRKALAAATGKTSQTYTDHLRYGL